ncbi:hypothetical protein MRX96_041595 [Rhipicephalus microplus]
MLTFTAVFYLVLVSSLADVEASAADSGGHGNPAHLNNLERSNSFDSSMLPEQEGRQMKEEKSSAFYNYEWF